MNLFLLNIFSSHGPESAYVAPFGRGLLQCAWVYVHVNLKRNDDRQRIKFDHAVTFGSRIRLWLYSISGGSRNFKIRGGGRSRRGRILWVWGLIWCPFTHNLCFLLRVENKINILNSVWWLQFKFMRVIQSWFAKINPK